MPADGLVRTVLDTSIHIAGLISRGGPSARVIVAMAQKKFDAIVSPKLLDEMVDVLVRPKTRAQTGLSLEEIATYHLFIKQHARPIDDSYEVKMVRDPKDNPIVAAALAGEAEYILSEDEDLLVLKDHLVKGHGLIRCMKPGLFLRTVLGLPHIDRSAESAG